MSTLRPRLCAIVLACCMTAAHAQAETATRLSLHDAEERALKNHPQIKAAEYSAQAADQSVRQARSAYFPTISASVTGAQAEAGSRIAAGGLNNPIILDRFATGIWVGQLLTDFGRTQALVQSLDYRADTLRQSVETRRGEILLQVDRSYFDAQRAQAVANVATETVTARQLVVDQVAALASSGLRSGLDLSFAKVNLAEAQLLLVQARNDVQSAFAALAAAMGDSDSPEYQLADEAIPPEPAASDSDIVEQALRDRPDIAGERFAGQAALKLAESENALWRPSISAVAVAGATPYRQVGLTSRYSAVGLNVSVPVMSGGLLSARRTEARLKASAEAEHLRDLQNTVTRDVRTASLNARASFLRMGLADQLREHATDAADLAQARYEMGLGSIVELSQAQLNKARAEIESATARYDYQIRAAVLKFQTGLLK